MNKDLRAVQTIRVLSVEQSTKAASGHPGIALGAAPIIHSLYSRIIRLSLKHPNWINRDRFILAAGHGSSLLYSLLHIAGFPISRSDMAQFRQYGSITPGHPEIDPKLGIDVTSGPLGQGIPEGVGMALAEAFLAAKFNRDNLNIIDHYTYVLCGDGDLQEGVTQEAFSLAGHLALNKLIVLYDSNDIQLDGVVSNANTESVREKYESMNWNYLFVGDGEDLSQIEKAILKAQTSSKPTLIEIKTIIGRGSSSENTSKVHGSPLSKDEVVKMRAALGGEEFSVDDEVYDFYRDTFGVRGEKCYQQWLEKYLTYQEQYPEDFELLGKLLSDTLSLDFDKLINFSADYHKATRVASGEIIDIISKHNPVFIGGSADLTTSTKAKGADGNFTKENRLGRNINFGVREHAMAAITNGMALHGGVKPFCSGFFVFSDYMKPAIRLAALMSLPVIYVFTHDSIAVGEDGPTHQPIEQLTMLRSIPRLQVIRPADANETKVAWDLAYHSRSNPTALVLTRQDVAMVTTEAEAQKLKFGAYILAPERERLDGILIASGSEVKLALEAKEKLLELGYDVRVVNMPSIELFEKQSSQYRNDILPTSVESKVAIEMSEGAHYYKYLGNKGKLLSIERFGLSGKYQELVPNFGFSVENIVKTFKETLD
jgi:transketolase